MTSDVSHNARMVLSMLSTVSKFRDLKLTIIVDFIVYIL